MIKIKKFRFFLSLLVCFTLLVGVWGGVPGGKVARANSSGYSTALGQLTAEGYALTPSFSPQTYFYTVYVPYSQSSLTVNAVPQDSRAAVTVSEGADSRVPLQVGSNIITISVMDPQGSSRLYTINAIRENIGLVNLMVDAGALNRPFEPEVTSYSVQIPRNLSYVQLTAMTHPDHSGITIKVNEQLVTSGVPTAVPIDKVTSLNIEVAAASGEKKFYTIALHRSSSTQAELAHLLVEGAHLDRNFDPAISEYYSRVGVEVSEIRISPIYGSHIRAVTIRGQQVTSGSYYRVPLAIGDNDIEIHTESVDGNKNTYYLNVTRLTTSGGGTPGAGSPGSPGTNPGGGWYNDGSGGRQYAVLSSIVVEHGDLHRSFDPDVLDYYSTVDYSISTTGIRVTFPSGVTAKINEQSVMSGQYYPLSLNVGENQAFIEVRNTSGDIRYYKLKINRFPHEFTDDSGAGGGQNGNHGGQIGDARAVLSSLLVDGVTLDRTFDSRVTDYFAVADYEQTSFRLSPLYNPSRVSVKISGLDVNHGEFFWVPLVVGLNTVAIDVTPNSGKASKYVITVLRLAEGQKDPGQEISAGSLLSIGPASVTFDRSFQPNEYVYRGFTTESTFTFTPVIASNARLRVNGISRPSGQELKLALAYGNNTFAVEVVPNDGRAVRTYTFTISRGDYSAEQFDISSVVIPGVSYNPAFTNLMDYYYATVSSGLNEIQMMVTATGANAITLNGKLLLNKELSDPFPLVVGDNKLELKVESPYSSNSKTYTFWIHRGDPEQETGFLRPYAANGDLIVPIPSKNEAFVSYNKLKSVLTENNYNNIRFQIGDEAEWNNPNYVMLSDTLVEYLGTHNKGIYVETEEVSIQLNPAAMGSNGLIVRLDRQDDSVGSVPAGFTAYSTPYGIKLMALDETGAERISPEISGTVSLRSGWSHGELESIQVYRYQEQLGWQPLPSDMVNGAKQFVVTGQSRVALMKPASAGAPEPTSPRLFSDTTGHWAFESINFLTSHGVIQGYEDGTFRPNQTITRAEFITLLVAMLGLEKSPAYSSFNDVDLQHWYYEAVITGADNRLIEGYDTGEFRPNANISREEVAVILERMLRQQIGVNTSLSASEEQIALSPFADVDQISWWARNAVAINVDLGIMNGMTAAELAPRAQATRAQIVVLLHNIWSSPWFNR
ncbi:cadherin-like beta sandwich domain-containing protein [Paenibacillus senegalensis]|uniref:cadherin-like beta sandwich domain-containing protein n=1 Tax=Paenibacillus senegalensis TaxID=1465766 RepID=UPI0002886640|nr:cadherin-like beta sandwich domain-containing protein [Paenibacillus senegalensis]